MAYKNTRTRTFFQRRDTFKGEPELVHVREARRVVQELDRANVDHGGWCAARTVADTRREERGKDAKRASNSAKFAALCRDASGSQIWCLVPLIPQLNS